MKRAFAILSALVALAPVRANDAALDDLRSAGVADGTITLVQRTNGAVRVAFTLRPTAQSLIRCKLSLPDPQCWDGRLWGLGNGGWAGSVGFAQKGNSATVGCDLGTSRTTRNDISEPPEILTDYATRATHLMTVAAKRLVKAYYGRVPDRSYFTGASCGGRQGLMEAIHFPEDYDGIVSEVPCITERSRSGHAWQRERLKKKFGAWFSADEIADVRAAELGYFASRDPAWARGKFIVNPYPTKETLDGCWQAIVARRPALADREALWRALFDPVVVDGQPYAPGRLLGVEFGSVWTFVMTKYARKRSPADFTEADLAAFAQNAEVFPTPDLAAFKARGGKIIMYGGLEDLSCAEPEIRAFYESVAKRMGGLDAVRPFFAYYAEPGRSHCAQGEADGSGLVGHPVGLGKKIVAWRERGEDPSAVDFKWLDGKNVLTVSPYPENAVSCSPSASRASTSPF